MPAFCFGRFYIYFEFYDYNKSKDITKNIKIPIKTLNNIIKVTEPITANMIFFNDFFRPLFQIVMLFSFTLFINKAPELIKWNHVNVEKINEKFIKKANDIAKIFIGIGVGA